MLIMEAAIQVPSVRAQQFSGAVVRGMLLVLLNLKGTPRNSDIARLLVTTDKMLSADDPSEVHDASAPLMYGGKDTGSK